MNTENCRSLLREAVQKYKEEAGRSPKYVHMNWMTYKIFWLAEASPLLTHLDGIMICISPYVPDREIILLHE